MANNPTPLGLVDGKLRPCPNTPNCVCSMDGAPARHIEPLAFRGDPNVAMSRLKAVLADQTRTRIVPEKSHYPHAACGSVVVRFLADLERQIDGPGQHTDA